VDNCRLVHFRLTIDLGLLSHGVDTIDVDIVRINNCTLGGCHMEVRVVMGQHGGVTRCVDIYTQCLLQGQCVTNDDGGHSPWEIMYLRSFVVTSISFFGIFHRGPCDMW
jgi:hypothetical protein